MASTPNDFIDLAVTSPPYGDMRDYDGFEFCPKKTASALFPKMKFGGVCAWVVGDTTKNGSKQMIPYTHAFAFTDVGFRLQDVIIWEKDTFQFPDRTRYRNCFEYIFIFSRGAPKTFNPITDRPNKWAGTAIHGTSRGKDGVSFQKSNHNAQIISDVGVRFNVWHSPTEKRNRTEHPAPFPEKLIEDIVTSWSNELDVVYDPFIGSGTTAVVARRLNRQWFGSEVSKRYVEIAEKRISNS